MIKKFLSVALCVAMVSAMAACGNQEGDGSGESIAAGADQSVSESEPESTESSEESSSEAEVPESSQETASEIDFDEEPYTIHICYAVGSEAQPDLPMIQEKLNEITLKEINANVELEAVGLFNAANTYALKASGQEKMDLMIMFPGHSYMTSYAANHLIMPIEEYVDQWGGSLKEVLGDQLEAGSFQGHLYAIPQNRDLRKNAYGFILSRELCEKHEINTDEIQTLEDLEAVFALIKEKEPNVTVLMPETVGNSIATYLMGEYDTCGTGDGVLKVEEDGSCHIVNLLEEEKTMESLKVIRSWYEKGYISKDILVEQERGASAMDAGKCFAMAAASIGPTDNSIGNISVLANEKPVIGTADDQMILWGVSSSCKRPDKAIQFLNLCYESAEIGNLMMYGVEGVHYNVADGIADTSISGNWVNNWGQFGDCNKLYVRKEWLDARGSGVTIEEYRAQNEAWEVEISPAYGFSFDPSNVRTEMANCEAVHTEYRNVIYNGTVDPEEELPKYIQKLYDAGLQKVLDEKQAQLEEWLASQE